MAFFGKLKSVFGFSGEEYEIEENELPQRDATVTPLAQRRRQDQNGGDNGNHAETAEAQTASAPKSPACSEPAKKECPEAIFNTVVEIFNKSLPDFIRESVDPEKQSKYIHEALDASMKAYIARLDQQAEERIRAKLEGDRTSLRSEIETLREKARKIEEASSEWQEQKLSAERQKRALSERVHDLEKQIDAFNAEKEQYELENRSLVNKLRAVSIQDTDLEALRIENESLRKEIVSLKENTTTVVTPAVDRNIMKELDELKEKVEDYAAQKENLLRERNMMANDIIVLKKKCEISDMMLNDLNHKASSAKLALSEKENQYNELQSKYDVLAAEISAGNHSEIEDKLREALALVETREKELAVANENIEGAHAELQRVNAELHNESVKVQQLTDDLRIAKEEAANAVSDSAADEIAAREATIAKLKNELSLAESELKEAKEEVNESRASLEAFEESLIKIDKINETRQNRIIELQLQVKDTEAKLDDTANRLAATAEEIARKDAEIASLKATIDNNMQIQVASEALLREEIERLRKPEPATRQKRKKTARISSIDESLDDTNWLVSTPPEGTNARPTGVSDAEFGYQAPQHRDEPNNPAQMSLW